jgi:hypothetical protein
MGRRSSLRDPAHVRGNIFGCGIQKGRAQEKAGSSSFGGQAATE